MSGNRTPLYDEHVRLGAKIVDFAGYDMPLHYGSQLEEHQQVRTDAGMFDVSHMTVTDVSGAGGRDFLRHVLANDVDKLVPGQALYTCMLNPDGRVLDDLIIYRLSEPSQWRLVTNAATREKDLAWLHQQAGDFDVSLQTHDASALIAIQGPRARDKVHGVLDESARAAAAQLGNFQAVEAGELFIAHTGYTGESGYEILVPAGRAVALWQALLEAGVKPVGLGARDTLRLEAGMALYGQDMDENTTPLETGLGWTIAWQPEDRDFIGRAALEALRDGGVRQKSVGLVLEGKGVLRAHQKVFAGDREVGEITSGSYSPVLERAIALARIDRDVGDDRCSVEMRGRRQDASVVKPPFVRHGKVRVQLS